MCTLIWGCDSKGGNDSHLHVFFGPLKSRVMRTFRPLKYAVLLDPVGGQISVTDIYHTIPPYTLSHFVQSVLVVLHLPSVLVGLQFSSTSYAQCLYMPQCLYFSLYILDGLKALSFIHSCPQAAAERSSSMGGTVNPLGTGDGLYGLSRSSRLFSSPTFLEYLCLGSTFQLLATRKYDARLLVLHAIAEKLG